MQIKIESLRARAVGCAAAASVLLLAAPAWAAGSGMPWEQPLQQSAGIGAGTGRENGRGDHHHHHRPHARVRRDRGRVPAADQIVFGLSIAFASSSDVVDCLFSAAELRLGGAKQQIVRILQRHHVSDSRSSDRRSSSACRADVHLRPAASPLGYLTVI
jgi:type IV secretion system protein VirB2